LLALPFHFVWRASVILTNEYGYKKHNKEPIL